MTSFWGELKRRNVVRVTVAYVIVGWLILQLTDVLVPLLTLPEWVGRLIFLLLLVGFPLALFFAWAYELTPEGLKKEEDVDRSESITPITGRKLDFAIIAVLAVALVFFASTHQWNSETGRAEITDKSIAVLAFTDLSPEGNQEYFSDGISEELLNVLAKIPGLRVAARTSSFKFKGENRDIIDIGEQLDVALVLEGSVRKAGAQIRITAQLVDASNGFHLWSETYTREPKNIFAVQDEISAAIVNALKDHLGLQVEAAPRVIAAANTEAHDAYLRGRYLMVQRARATIEGAVREFQKAITLDPEYALAHAELAMATLKRGGVLNFDLTVTEAIARAAPHAKRAMALDPTLAEVHAATGFLLWRQQNLEGAQTHFRQAIKINPNYSVVYIWMGRLLNWDLGLYKESFAVYETVLRLDPLRTVSYVFGLIARNRLDEADREMEKIAAISPVGYARLWAYRTSLGGKWANAVLGNLDALRIDPGSRFDKAWLSESLASIGLEKEALAISEAPPPLTLSRLGRPEDAVMTAEARLAEEPNSLKARRDLGMALAAAGDYARAGPILEEMWQRSGRRVTSYGLFWSISAAALIASRLDASEDAEVGELLAAIKDNVRRYREAGISTYELCCGVDYEAGLGEYLAGDRESGLALIAKAAEDGTFILPAEAYLQTIYDDPDFAPIRANQETRQRRERDRLLDIVCTDNPYATVWQPEEGTCEQFAATIGN